MLEGLRARFALDVAALAFHGLPNFNASFDTMAAMCAKNGRVCNTLHEPTPWTAEMSESARSPAEVLADGGLSRARAARTSLAAALAPVDVSR